MKTAKQKARAFLNQYKGNEELSVNPFSEELELNILMGIERLLKEQDRDTRHACAEAVNGCDPMGLAPTIIDDCHAACINVKV